MNKYCFVSNMGTNGIRQQVQVQASNGFKNVWRTKLFISQTPGNSVLLGNKMISEVCKQGLGISDLRKTKDGMTYCEATNWSSSGTTIELFDEEIGRNPWPKAFLSSLIFCFCSLIVWQQKQKNSNALATINAGDLKNRWHVGRCFWIHAQKNETDGSLH